MWSLAADPYIQYFPALNPGMSIRAVNLYLFSISALQKEEI